jgi:hypothetical protein
MRDVAAVVVRTGIISCRTVQRLRAAAVVEAAAIALNGARIGIRARGAIDCRAAAASRGSCEGCDCSHRRREGERCESAQSTARTGNCARCEISRSRSRAKRTRRFRNCDVTRARRTGDEHQSLWPNLKVNVLTRLARKTERINDRRPQLRRARRRCRRRWVRRNRRVRIPAQDNRKLLGLGRRRWRCRRRRVRPSCCCCCMRRLH